jgi:hypothetical protein
MFIHVGATAFEVSNIDREGRRERAPMTNATICEAVAAFKDESADFNSPAAALEYGPIAGWDVSQDTNMRELFCGCLQFNEDIRGVGAGKFDVEFELER